MATSLEEVTGYLVQIGCPKLGRRGNELVFAAPCKQYVAPETHHNMLRELLADPGRSQGPAGLHAVLVSLWISNTGEHLHLSAPAAFSLKGKHGDAFLRACTMLQWWTSLVQFEYNGTDGEIRPTVELPLADARLTRAQLAACLGTLVGVLDQHYKGLRRAIDEGVLDGIPRPARPEEMAAHLRKMLAELEKRSEGGGKAPDSL